MGFDDGQVILDSDNGAYYSGQNVFGKVIFSQGKNKTIHGIYVDLKGYCKVHWTTHHTRRVNNRTESYTVSHDSYEEYFRTKIFLIGSDSGEHHLQAGDHEFRFNLAIPNNCPASFEGTYGHIRYRVKAIMVTSGMFTMNKTIMVPIKVHVPVDLNQNPYCKEPIEYELISSYCCWCVSAGSSVVMVKLPAGGYCPGQVIVMDVSCKNESNVEIDELKFAIKKDVTFRAVHAPGTKYAHDTVAEIKKGPIPPRTTRNWTVEFEVPAMDIYNFDACSFIDIAYEFKVSTEVSGCHKGTDDSSPIIFGTIPLVGFQDNVQNPLHDQLPKSMEAQNSQGLNSYPYPPTINPPRSNSPYKGGKVYPSDSSYPGGNPAFPTTPVFGRTSPYPPENQPFPNVTPYPPNQPYPYPAGNSPYPPGNSPYPAGNSPYPPGNSPYPPENSPYPPGNSPYPGKSPNPTNTPYSTDNSHGADADPPPYPGTVPPYPTAAGTTFKTGTIGFMGTGDKASVPLLPMGANVPYPTGPPANPYASASAPEPSTPGSDSKMLPLGGDGTPQETSTYPAYNPDFMKMKASDKKDEKSN